MTKSKIKGRGSQHKIHNPFQERVYEAEREYQEWQHQNGEDPLADERTKWTSVKAKSIVNPILSPDIGHRWSLNPYQGCEHGCSYCYARNTHSYWAMDAAVDFERHILVKENAPELLMRHLEKKSWKPAAIMLSGNTDCYQPLERKFKITRSLLEVFLEYRNPVGIITKNSLVERDIDLLAKLAEHRLVQVALSINTLNEDLRRAMEPRTASVKRRLQTIERLTAAGVPVRIMMAPIIPGLNSHEVLTLGKAVADAGALDLNYTMLRLNGQLQEIFLPWLESHFPDRYEKVKNLVASTHDGQLNDSQFGRRMRGDGALAAQVRQSIKLAQSRFFKVNAVPEYNLQAFRQMRRGQYNLFEE